MQIRGDYQAVENFLNQTGIFLNQIQIAFKNSIIIIIIHENDRFVHEN
jgi:hypothetical protein